MTLFLDVVKSIFNVCSSSLSSFTEIFLAINNRELSPLPAAIGRGDERINPYTKLACRFVDNGTETISNGIAIIEEWTGGDINITAYSGIFDFFDTIGDKTLRDLDLSDSDHIFNLDNVEAGTSSLFS